MVTFAQEYPRYRMNDDREVRCYALAAEMATGWPDTVTEFKRLWYAQKEADDGCNFAASQLYNAKKISTAEVWQKVWLAAEKFSPSDGTRIEVLKLVLIVMSEIGR